LKNFQQRKNSDFFPIKFLFFYEKEGKRFLKDFSIFSRNKKFEMFLLNNLLIKKLP